MPRALTPEIYKLVVEAFVQRPEEHYWVAKHCKISRATAEKAWKHGWCDTHHRPYAWAPPIGVNLQQFRKDIEIQKRQEALDAERQAAKFRQEARTDAGETHTQEGVLVKNARASVTALLTVSGRMAPALGVLGQQLADAINKGGIDPTKASRIVRDLTAAASSMTRAGQIAMQMERLYRGDPTEIVGVRDSEMTLEEAQLEIEAANDALKRMQRGGLEVIEGGAEDQPEDGGEVLAN